MNEIHRLFAIKLANENDMLEIIPLLDQLGYPQNSDSFRKRYLEFIATPGYGIAIAQQEGAIVGMIAWSKALLLVSNAVRMRVEGLVVDQKYQRQGIGKQLMNFFENFSKQFSPCVLEITSGIRRAKDGSHDFYKSLGYYNDDDMAKLYLRKDL